MHLPIVMNPRLSVGGRYASNLDVYEYGVGPEEHLVGAYRYGALETHLGFLIETPLGMNIDE